MTRTSSQPGPRLATAAALVAWAITMALGVVDALPQWIVGTATALDVEPSTLLRILTGLLVASGGAIVALGRSGRGVARIAAFALVFNAIAQAAHVWRRGVEDADGWWLVVASGVIGAALIAWFGRRPTTEASRPPGRAGLRGVGIAAACLIGAAIAANLEIDVPRNLREGAVVSRGRVLEDLSTEAWLGLALEETPLLEHLPQVGPLAASQSTLVAFYRPECGSCHEFFDDTLGSPPPARTIAVRVPPAEGVDTVETDLPDDITCGSCIRLALPEGPIWIVQTPALMLVQDGVVTCVSDDDFDRCLDLLRDPARD